MVHIFCVEGNIAAGKSTLLQHVQELDANIVVIPERVASWQGRETGINLLQRFYEEPESTAFPFQLMVLHTRIHDVMRAMKNATQDTIVLVERSLESDRIFAKQNRDLGRISDLEWAVYELMFHESQTLMHVKGRILLEVPVSVLEQRIASRGRSEEDAITRSYLSALDTAHNEKFASMSNVYRAKNEDINCVAKHTLAWMRQMIEK